MLLGDISEIKTGLVLSRKRPKFNTVATYQVLTVKSITGNGLIDHGELDSFDSGEEVDVDYITRRGDIVLRLSEPNSAAFIGSDDEGLLVSSYCCFIRVIDRSFLPEFLVWYLNSDFSKAQTRRLTAGSSLGFMSTQLLRSIEVPIVTLARQEQILSIHRIGRKQQELLTELSDLNADLAKAMIQKLMHHEREEAQC